MSGGTAKPKLDNAQKSGDFYESLISSGLPKDLKDRLLAQGSGAIGGRINSGVQGLKEAYASQGGVTGRALNEGFGQVSQSGAGALQDLYSNVAQQDFGARLQGAGGKLNQAGLNNQSELSRYQIEKANEFSWGDALGGLLGAGGSIGGAAMTKPKG